MIRLDFIAVLAAWRPFMAGTLMTILLTAAILVVSTPAGLALAVARDSRWGIVRLCVAVASGVCRGVPPLLLLLIVFFVPAQFGLNLSSFLSAVIGMSTYMSFYFAEVFRGGLASVGRGQYQAADSLGLGPVRTFRRIIFPQILPTVIPSYVSHASSLLKETALASAVAVQELTGVAKGLFSVTYRPIETLLVVGVIYAALSTVMFGLQFMFERRLAGRGRKV